MMRVVLSLLGSTLGQERTFLLAGQYADKEPIEPPCFHGSRVDGSCACYPHWRHSGPTDTLQFLFGRCDQFVCQSNRQCQALLPEVSSPTCEIPGWNCYCGMAWSLSGHLSGYENKDAKCMGAMYVLSVWGTNHLKNVLRYAWILFVTLAFLCLPLGQTHLRCQHHKPDALRLMHATGALRIVGWDYQCPGTCEEYNNSHWYPLLDNAWSIYWLDLGLWFYVFSVLVWAGLLVSWVAILWIIIVITILLALILAAVGALLSCLGCSDGDSGGSGSCDCCEHNPCSCCDNPCSCCDSPCSCCDNGGGCCPASNVSGPTWTDIYIWDATFNTGGSVDDRACFCTDCTKCIPRKGCVALVMLPAAYVLMSFPRMPSNVWGGCLGRFVFGTHPGHSPCVNSYTGNSRCINLLNWRGARDLRQEEAWRASVYNYLYQQAFQGEETQLATLQHDEQPQRLTPHVTTDISIG